eukprot:Platyproteum_vivax@DN11489_c0_g1_i1.p1
MSVKSHKSHKSVVSHTESEHQFRILWYHTTLKRSLKLHKGIWKEISHLKLEAERKKQLIIKFRIFFNTFRTDSSKNSAAENFVEEDPLNNSATESMFSTEFIHMRSHTVQKISSIRTLKSLCKRLSNETVNMLGYLQLLQGEVALLQELNESLQALRRTVKIQHSADVIMGDKFSGWVCDIVLQLRKIQKRIDSKTLFEMCLGTVLFMIPFFS